MRAMLLNIVLATRNVKPPRSGKARGSFCDFHGKDSSKIVASLLGELSLDRVKAGPLSTVKCEVVIRRKIVRFRCSSIVKGFSGQRSI